MKFYRINALLLKYYYISINRLDRLFDLFYWPLLDIFIWGFMTYYIKDISEINVLSMIMGGIVLWLFLWRSGQDIAIFVLEDYWSRNLYNLFTSPITTFELVSSLLMVALIRTFISFTVLISLAFLLYKVNVLSMGFMNFAVFAGILIIFGWALGLFIAAVIFRYGQRIQVFAWSVAWIIQPFSCVFYPLESLPNWIQSISKVIPITYVFENMRAVLWGNAVNWNGILYALISSVVLFIVGGFVLGKSIGHAKKVGSISKSE